MWCLAPTWERGLAGHESHSDTSTNLCEQTSMGSCGRTLGMIMDIQLFSKLNNGQTMNKETSWNVTWLCLLFHSLHGIEQYYFLLLCAKYFLHNPFKVSFIQSCMTLSQHIWYQTKEYELTFHDIQQYSYVYEIKCCEWKLGSAFLHTPCMWQLGKSFCLKVVDLICMPALNILKFGMNEECTIFYDIWIFKVVGCKTFK